MFTRAVNTNTSTRQMAVMAMDLMWAEELAGVAVLVLLDMGMPPYFLCDGSQEYPSWGTVPRIAQR